MTCCLFCTSHNLYQCWPIVNYNIGLYLSAFMFEIQPLSVCKTIYLEMSSLKLWPFCSGSQCVKSIAAHFWIEIYRTKRRFPSTSAPLPTWRLIKILAPGICRRTLLSRGGCWQACSQTIFIAWQINSKNQKVTNPLLACLASESDSSPLKDW